VTALLTMSRWCAAIAACLTLCAWLGAVHPALTGVATYAAVVMLARRRSVVERDDTGEPCHHRNRYAPGPRVPRRDVVFGRVIETRGK